MKNKLTREQQEVLAECVADKFPEHMRAVTKEFMLGVFEMGAAVNIDFGFESVESKCDISVAKGIGLPTHRISKNPYVKLSIYVAKQKEIVDEIQENIQEEMDIDPELRTGLPEFL